MSELTAVLPKRRKRRRPTREELRCFLWTGWGIFFALWGIYWFAWCLRKNVYWASALDLICGGINFACVRYVFWPVVWNYIKNGYDDEQ